MTRPSLSAASLVDQFQRRLGPFVVAAETSRMATAFTDGTLAANPIVYANNAFLNLTGFTRIMILGTPLNDLLGDVTDKTTVASIRATLAQGHSGSWEMQCRRADLSEFLAAVFVSPVHDDAGAVVHNVVSIVELGGHVERLLDQRNEFHAIYEQAPGFIATSKGPEHCFTFANAAYRKFVGREELVGRTVAEALPEIVQQEFIGRLDAVYRTGVPFVGRGMPMSVLDPAIGQLRVRYCDFVYQPVRDGKNRIIGLFCEGYDVTEQREMAQALTALQSELIRVARINTMGAMATELAHELNQPLCAIANFTMGAQRRIGLAAAADVGISEALKGIEVATQRASDIIRNLREMTRRREPVRSAFDLNVAVGECVRLVRATVPSEVEMSEAIADGIIILADRIQIQQVIINLLRNACDALDGASRQKVTIEAMVGADAVIVSVTDTGGGVPGDLTETIFSSSGSSKEGGMGLGLMISQTIMQAHGGRIWLAKTGPGGSQFSISLPAAV